MALDVNLLKNEILKLIDETNPAFAGFPVDRSLAITNWGNAYNTYASMATDVSGDSVIVANLPGFTGALTANLPPAAVGIPAQAANAFDLAFVAYWMSATFSILSLPLGGVGGNGIFGVKLTSTVIAVAPGVLGADLTNQFSIISADVNERALSIATAFHTATISAVTVLITGLDTTPPPGGPLPITNTAMLL